MSAISILIPAVEKDLATLPYVIDSARQHVKHPIAQIVVVAPRRKKIMALCRRKQCRFVDETTVLPITKNDIHYRTRKWERSGWLYQQLLKMSGDALVKTNNFLVMDADTVLIRPHVFLAGGKPVFYCRNWSQPEYFRAYRRLLGRRRVTRASFVAHYMLFNKAILAKLKRAIEARNGTRWYTAIIRKIDKTKPFAFSEFETYGHFLYAVNPAGMIRRKALNKSLSISIRKLGVKRIRELSGRYRSLSFHQRKAYRRADNRPKKRLRA